MSLSFHTLSNLVLDMLLVLEDTAQLGKLFHIFTTVLEKPYFRGLNFAQDFLSLKSFLLVTCKHCNIDTTHDLYFQ